MGRGQETWERAKKIIPGGNMFLSKRSEMYLPGQWPAYYSKAKGCRIWDLDGREFIDTGLMGAGTNILGYGHSYVDAAVRKAVEAGNLSSLNCPEEVQLCQQLIDLHPWSSMAKLARTGGEACAIATRIGRAFTGKSGVAICGYHGWHDWYLAANISDDDALDGHILPGLKPMGVPKELSGTTRPFFYNDLNGLEKILSDGNTGVIYMEVERSTPPKEGFLEGVRKLADDYGAVLIFDECSSGFRIIRGGTHLIHGVFPDMAMFGKTLGNGYAITAVIGTEEVMQSAQDTFISSTFWTERIGPAAAIASLEVMETENAPERINQLGSKVRKIWKNIAIKNGLEISISGLPSLSTFSIKGFEPSTLKTFIVQEMLHRGYISGPFFYSCIEHEEVLDGYQESLDEVFQMISNLGDTEGLRSKIEGEICHSGFQRLA